MIQIFKQVKLDNRKLNMINETGDSMIKISMPKSVKLIINILEKNGFEAYAVGGCVRDAVIGREPNDWDITTSATPQEVKKIFHKTIDTGIKHGTVTVMIERTGYEVTTYRIDGEYEDGRRPKSVAFTRNLVEDLKRRDFTINAMAYNDRAGIVDEFDGVGDLRRGLIKCVGNPEDRFNEDALRILRAVRFAAALDFEIEENTKAAIIELAANLEKISKERIQAELEKLMMSGHPEKLKSACDIGITGVIFDEIDRIAQMGRLESVLKLVCEMPAKHYLRWSAVLVMSDRQRVSKILEGFKFDNKTVNVVSRIVEAVHRPLPANRAEIRRDICEIGEDIYEEYLRFMSIYLVSEVFMQNASEGIYVIDKTFEDIKVHEKNLENNENNDIESMVIKKCKVYYHYLAAQYRDIIEKHECLSLKTLAVNGRDLIEMGLERGEQVGMELTRLLYLVLEDETLNNRDRLLAIVQKDIR